MLRLVPPRPREVPAREVADAPVVEGLASGPFPAPRRSLVAYYLMVSVTVGLIVLAVLRWLDTPPAPILIPTGF